MNESPSFWWRNRSLIVWLLAPISFAYGWVTGQRVRSAPRYTSSLPVLCVGNFIAGGAGKTPTALALAQAARIEGYNPGFLSRGYGGHIHQPTVVDLNLHNAHDVGDEPLLLAAQALTVISPDRPKGAKLLEQQDIDFIIMDDGFQNPSLAKDYSLVVVDAKRGIGNGFAMPGGPLRANLGAQLAAASAVLVIGHDRGADRVIRAAARRAKPVYEALIKPLRPTRWKGRKVLAFAGIADPQKFFASLTAAGAKIVEMREFGDHHQLTKEEADGILGKANRNGLDIVTTSKDAARLGGLGRSQDELLSQSEIFDIELKFENERTLRAIITNTVENARNKRLSRV